MRGQKQNTLIAISLIVLAVSLRLLPHPANFAPVGAVAIFGGSILPRRLGVWIPLAAMVVSDSFIGFYDTILVTWACYGLIALASSYAMRKPSLFKGFSLTIAGSLFFFAVTNFATWLWSGMYAHSLAGLSQCYAMALPFFRNTALSDLVYSGSLFGVYYLATRATKKALKPSTAG